MVEFSACPPQALAAAEAACGGRADLKEITDRRGSAVWKATGPTGTVAVKIGYGEGQAVTTREATTLEALDLPEYEVTSGNYEGDSWLVTPWFNGPSTWEVFTPVRKHTEGQAQAVAAAIELCQAVAILHARGWVHTDLQPSHSIHPPRGVRLIDFAWSWQMGQAPDRRKAFANDLTHPQLLAVSAAF